MDGLERGQFEGHAFQFIHRRLLKDQVLPVIPVILNTFDPPNQPTPRRCVALGAALRELIAAWPQDLRVGVIASGGLSHFVVDEALDQQVIGRGCHRRFRVQGRRGKGENQRQQRADHAGSPKSNWLVGMISIRVKSIKRPQLSIIVARLASTVSGAAGSITSASIP